MHNPSDYNMEVVMDRDHDGKVKTYGLSLNDVKPHSTLHFCQNGVHTMVYVDKDNLPVGVFLVLP